MHKVIVISSDTSVSTNAIEGTLLSAHLRENGFGIDTPCGGNGTCGKCLVEVVGKGEVKSCTFKIGADCTVRLQKQKSTANILSSISPVVRTIPINGLPKSCPDFGLALDIGTTTVVALLVDKNTGEALDRVVFLNPQAEYGLDVISRINFTIEDVKGLSVLHNTLIRAINKSIYALCEKAGISKESISEIVVAANTTMLHIFSNTSPKSLAFYPFTPEFTDTKTCTANEAGLVAAPSSRITLLPSVSAFVGADISAGLTAVPILESNKTALFIDIGTNGEIALGNADGFLCCATAAGPAFEGAKISCGMGAVAGAISSFTDNGTYTTIGGIKPLGICGSALIDIVAYLLKSGRISPEGLLEEPFQIVPPAESATNRAIAITPKDIRELQLAKAAISAGIKLLIKQAGISFCQIEHLYIAGGFGAFVNINNAITIGLLPTELKDRIVLAGNTSLAGAFLSVRNSSFINEINNTIHKCTAIDLSAIPEFNDTFVDEMFFRIT